MKILADKELFDKWQELGEKISMMKSFVQNDDDHVTEEEYTNFIRMGNKLKQELISLIGLTDISFDD